MNNSINLLLILVVLLIFNGSCTSNSAQPHNDPELVKRLNRVNEILDELEKKSPSSVNLGGDSRMAREIIGSEYAYLIENSDIAMPLMFERLDNKKLSRRSLPVYFNLPLIVYFVVFEKTKSAESIPYIADYIASVSREEAECFYTSRREKETYYTFLTWDVFVYALVAAGKIMYPHPIPSNDISFPEFVNQIMRLQIGGKRTLFDERLNIANQLRKWYEEYKKNQDKK